MNSKKLYEFRKSNFNSISKKSILALAEVVYYAFNGHNVIANIKSNECSISSLITNNKHDIVCVVKLATLKVPVVFKIDVDHFRYKFKDFALLIKVDNKISQKLEIAYNIEQNIKAFMIDYGFKALANSAKAELNRHDNLIVK